MVYKRYRQTPSRILSTAMGAGLGVIASRFKKRYGATKLSSPSKMKRRLRFGYKGRSGSRTTTKKRSKEVLTSYGEYTKGVVSRGRPLAKSLRNAWRILDNQKTKTILSFRAYSQAFGANGALYLKNVSTTPTTGNLEVPCHIYDISASPNVVNGVASYPWIRYIPYFSDPTASGTLLWDNNSSSQMVIENTDSSTSVINSYPAGGDIMEWVKAKILFYAPTSVPSRFQIDVIQIKDTRLNPGDASGAFATAFYQAMIKRFAYSPLEDGDTKYSKYFKTLHSQSFILNPKETTENVSTVYREVNLFMRLNRKCNYAWEDKDPMAMIAQDGQINTDTNIKTVLHPRARIYLVIRAQSKNGSAVSTSLHPSYDIVLKTCHSQLNS